MSAFPTSDRSRRLRRLAFRLVVALAIAGVALAGLDWLDNRLEHADPTTRASAIGIVLIIYALLIAIPFVPGVEIALTIMMMKGPGVAPAIYAATVLGLMIAYLVGRFLPPGWLIRTCRDIGMTRTADNWQDMLSKSLSERLGLLHARLPARLSWIATDFRYLMIAALINMPGSSVIGGGGGIMLVAGISQLFSTHAVLATLALAVLPVPLAVWVLGPAIFE